MRKVFCFVVILAQQIASYMDQRINALEDVAMIVGVATQEEFEVLIDSRNDSLLESYGCFSKGAGKQNVTNHCILYSTL